MDDGQEISAEARASLAKQEAWRDLMPEFRAARERRVIETLAAEFVSDSPLNQVRRFTECVSAGVTPPASLIVSIGEAFKRYLNADGQLSLDAAFDLKPVQRRGHPLVAERRDAERAQALRHMGMLLLTSMVDNKGVKQAQEWAAGETINALGLDIDEGTLCRDYRELGMAAYFEDEFCRELLVQWEQMPQEQKQRIREQYAKHGLGK